MLKSGLVDFLTDIETLSLLLAAAVHDIGHDGFSNNYHKNSMSERAVSPCACACPCPALSSKTRPSLLGNFVA